MELKKGPLITKWSEPREWNGVLLRLGKENLPPRSRTRFLPYIFAGVLIVSAFVWQWLDADHEGMTSTLATLIAAVFISGVLLLSHRLKMKFFPTRVWIYENGIEMGDLLGERKWTELSEITGYFFESDIFEGKAYRLWYWLPEGAQYPDSAVIPSFIYEDKIKVFLASKGLEELSSEDH